MDDLKQRLDALTADLDPIQHLRALDYPRRAGTEGERRAAAYVADQLRELGLEPTIQAFRYAKQKALPKLVLPLVLLFWTLLSLVNIRYWESNSIVSLLVLAFPLFLILAILNGKRLLRYAFGKRRNRLAAVETKIEDGSLSPDRIIASQNVLVEVGPHDAEHHVLFTAHLDSISSGLPMPVSGPLRVLGLFGFLVYSGCYLFHVILGPYMQRQFAIWVGLALISLLLLEIGLLSRLFRGNASHGIIDDGTGVAILLELAKHLCAHPVPGTRYTIGFYGAEEAGLVGSTYHYMQRSPDAPKPRVVSVDMIGEKPPLVYVKRIAIGRLPMGTAFNARIAALAEALGIEIKGKTFPYPGSDFGQYLVDGDCTTNWLINKSRLIHSRNDHLGAVNAELVRDALRLMVAYLS